MSSVRRQDKEGDTGNALRPPQPRISQNVDGSKGLLFTLTRVLVSIVANVLMRYFVLYVAAEGPGEAAASGSATAERDAARSREVLHRADEQDATGRQQSAHALHAPSNQFYPPTRSLE